MGEAVTDVIPNIVMAAVAPVLSGIFLVTEHFLCEMRIPSAGEDANFDVLDKRTVLNYRVSTRTHQVVSRGNGSIELSNCRD